MSCGNVLKILRPPEPPGSRQGGVNYISRQENKNVTQYIKTREIHVVLEILFQMFFLTITKTSIPNFKFWNIINIKCFK